MSFLVSHKAFLPALMLLGIGLVVRLALLPVMLYDFDEGIAGIYALQFVGQGQFPMHGIRTSLGFHNPPFFIWLISLPTLLSRNPSLTVALLHLLNILAVGGLAWQLYRSGFKSIATAVALFGALAPGALLLEHRMWGHALIPAASTALVSCLWHLNRQPRSPLVSLAIPLLIAAAQQSHFSGALLLFPVAGVSLYFGLRYSLRWLGIGVCLANAIYLPWLIHDYKNGWANLHTILNIVTQGAQAEPDRTTFHHAILFSLTDFGSVTAFGSDGYSRWLGFLPWIVPYKIAGLAVLVAGFLTVTRRLFLKRGGEGKSEARFMGVIALIWMVVPAVAFTVLRVQPVPAYWLPALPGPWLLAGLAVELAPRRRPLVTQVATFGFVVASLAYLLGYAAIMYRGDSRYQLHPSFRDQVAAIFYVSEMTKDKPYYLRQELRNYESGLDYNLLYLLSWAEGNGTRLRPGADAAATRLEAIYHNSAAQWPVEEARSRADYLFEQFGLVQILMQQKNQ